MCYNTLEDPCTDKKLTCPSDSHCPPSPPNPPSYSVAAFASCLVKTDLPLPPRPTRDPPAPPSDPVSYSESPPRGPLDAPPDRIDREGERDGEREETESECRGGSDGGRTGGEKGGRVAFGGRPARCSVWEKEKNNQAYFNI